MEDENKTDDTAVVVEANNQADAAVRKKRGPRMKKVVSDATTSQASSSPTARVGRKSREKPAELKTATPTKAVAKTKAKGVARAAGKPAATKPSTEAPIPVLDEIADLLQLEEENARLRKALAEKLRAENTELRKRLGLN